MTPNGFSVPKLKAADASAKHSSATPAESHSIEPPVLPRCTKTILRKHHKENLSKKLNQFVDKHNFSNIWSNTGDDDNIPSLGHQPERQKSVKEFLLNDSISKLA